MNRIQLLMSYFILSISILLNCFIEHKSEKAHPGCRYGRSQSPYSIL